MRVPWARSSQVRALRWSASETLGARAGSVREKVDLWASRALQVLIGEALIGDGGGVGQAVEGERPVVEVAGVVGLLGEIVVADFRAVLGVDEFAQLAGHAVDALVQAFGLGVEDMDEAVEELVAVRGERRAVGRESWSR